MRQRIDFTAICERVTIVQVAQLLKIVMKKEPDGYRCACPTRPNDARSIKITPGFRRKNGVLGSWYCHQCRKDGDAIGLYAHIKDCDNYDAAKAISEHFGIDSASDTSTEPPRGEPEGRGSAMEPLDYLVSDHPVNEVLGVPAAAMQALGAGYAPKGTMKGRVLIPLRLPSGELVGYCGIATREEQIPLLEFPKNLAERCGVATVAPEIEPEEEIAEEPSPQELRKLFRVV